MAIGQRIRYFRTRIGMTQKQLGESSWFSWKNFGRPCGTI